jgi:hypothetical protein
MTAIRFSRRQLMIGGSTALLVAPWLKPLSAGDVQLQADSVRFQPGIEPLVRLIEETPRESLLIEVAKRIRSGVPYTEWLAATLLAGIRNVQPRPNVGFKFHCVMVMHAAHQATQAARDEHRWFPLFWAMDYFKSCQQQDRNEGDWTMTAVDPQSLPATQALSELRAALDQWDVEKGDRAAAAAACSASPAQLLELFARYGSRDFRNIGHKAIWVAGAFRTLEVIGWQHAEPVIRSLTFALLNHSGEANPAQNDLAADRSGKVNWELARDMPSASDPGKIDDGYAQDWLIAARKENPTNLARLTAEGMQKGIPAVTLYDGIFGAASELVMRQPAIVPLHAVTSSNALHYLQRTVSNDALRSWLILQNAAFIGHFREAAEQRGKLSSANLLEMPESNQLALNVDSIFELLGEDKNAGSAAILRYIDQGNDLAALLRRARELVLLKGTDSHDYKFSSAIFEDYQYCSPQWQKKVLAAAAHLLPHAKQADNGLKSRIVEAFGA